MSTRESLIKKLGSALLPFALILAACQTETDHHAGSDGDGAKVRTSISPFRNPVTMSDSNQISVDVPPVEPGEILRSIYRKDGDGSSSYEVENNAWVSYWYGHNYEIDGNRYFTGFAYRTSEYSENESEIAGPNDQVIVSQATYALAPKGSAALWEFIGAEHDIGSFGGRERGNTAEKDAAPTTYLMADGGYLLAIPAWYLEAGVRLKTAEIFLLKGARHGWQYLGSIATGEDNSASCSDEQVGKGLSPCAVSTGTLEFQQRPGMEMPLIRVVMKGMVMASPGKTRDLGPLDTTDYHYDHAVSKKYKVIR